jgi:hypothetical protein
MKSVLHALRQVLWFFLDLLPGIILVLVGMVVASQLYPTLLKGSESLTLFEKAQIVTYVLFAGGTAALWKRKDQYRYGMTELMFAGVLAWRTASAQLTQEPLANVTILVATAYIASRAFQNIFDGLLKIRGSARTKNPTAS